ncbi:hypothetical protein HK57_00261 [Aspergillus ustus]|uniref:F-box domain-containing protein n=1 Tax=Aspergillus ustus TaxID=40382 RepID=A0A0C1EH17_ASPUT|nr:hypothetical protein HK57_00261 [Aspergillus ustus]
MAVQTVFAIPELLEAIFIEVDTGTLLTSAQRVSRHWNAVIKGSLQLQTRLFFQPSKTPLVGSPSPYNDLRLTNPYFEKIWNEHFSRNYIISHGSNQQQHASSAVTIYRRPEASWRRMLLRQPPQAQICIFGPKTLINPETGNRETALTALDVPIFQRNGTADNKDKNENENENQKKKKKREKKQETEFIRFGMLEDAFEAGIIGRPANVLPGQLTAPQLFHPSLADALIWGRQWTGFGIVTPKNTHWHVERKKDPREMLDQRCDIVISLCAGGLIRMLSDESSPAHSIPRELLRWLREVLEADSESIRRLEGWGGNRR